MFPHIAVCCFEVGDDVAAQLQAAAPARTDVVQRMADGKPHVSLRNVALARLAALGIAAERVEQVSGCTACDAARFFSFRRDGQASGRHLTVIVSG
jgi:copper oxidase (laccase) domain-containing protein